MQFPITVIEDMARQARGRWFSSCYPAISAYSKALITQHIGIIHNVDIGTLKTLANCPIEKFMPLPYRQNYLCLSSQTLQFDRLPPVKYAASESNNVPIEAAFNSIYRDYGWCIVVEGVDGAWYIIANSRENYFEPGELMRSAEPPFGTVQVNNCYISGGNVCWVIADWQGASRIFGAEAYYSNLFTRNLSELPNNQYGTLAECSDVKNIDWLKVFTSDTAFHEYITDAKTVTWEGFIQIAQKLGYNPWDFAYKRPEPVTLGATSTVVETIGEAAMTFISDEILDVLDIRLPEMSSPVSVGDLLQYLMVSLKNDTSEEPEDAETVAPDNDEDPEGEMIRAKLLKALNFDKAVEDIRALRPPQRTFTNIKKIVQDHLRK